MLFLTLGPSNPPVVVTLNLTKVMQTEQLLCWSGTTDTEHISIIITSSSNEEDDHANGIYDKSKSLYRYDNIYCNHFNKK